jgi:hypothetical protein
MSVATRRFGNGQLFTGGAGTNDNDVIYTTGDISEYDSFLLMSTAGAMDVFPTLDGTNYATAGISLTDMGASDLSPVVVTAANRIYGFRGKFLGFKVLQNGATGVTAPSVMCGVIGSRS